MTQNNTANLVVRGYIMLLLTAILWGTAFIFQKNATDHVDTFSFNFLRFGIAIPALMLLRLLPKSLFVPDEADSEAGKRRFHSAWVIGGVGGIFMFLGISLQQWGLSYTTAGKSGFLTSLYIIVVPILALFIGQRCRAEVWVGALLTLLGVYLLGSAETDDVESQLNIGDLMTVLCSIAWAAQVLWLGIFARWANVLNIAIIQMSVVTVLSGLTMFGLWIFDGDGSYSLPTLETVLAISDAILYTGVVSAAFAFTLQILGQRYVPPTNAAMIMSTEAIFALLAGIIFLGESLTILAFLGFVCILAGIILAQLQGKVFNKHTSPPTST